MEVSDVLQQLPFLFFAGFALACSKLVMLTFVKNAFCVVASYPNNGMCRLLLTFACSETCFC